VSLIPLSLETVKDLDGGRPSLAFSHAVEQCVLDCKDRPMDERARKISLEFSLSPVAEESDVAGVFNLASVEGGFKIKVAMPNRQTKTYSFGINRQGKLFFSETSPGNVAQTTFEDVDPESGRVKRDLEE